jgi:hypothetical protein
LKRLDSSAEMHRAGRKWSCGEHVCVDAKASESRAFGRPSFTRVEINSTIGLAPLRADLVRAETGERHDRVCWRVLTARRHLIDDAAGVT